MRLPGDGYLLTEVANGKIAYYEVEDLSLHSSHIVKFFQGATRYLWLVYFDCARFASYEG